MSEKPPIERARELGMSLIEFNNSRSIEILSERDSITRWSYAALLTLNSGGLVLCIDQLNSGISLRPLALACFLFLAGVYSSLGIALFYYRQANKVTDGLQNSSLQMRTDLIKISSPIELFEKIGENLPPTARPPQIHYNLTVCSSAFFVLGSLVFAVAFLQSGANKTSPVAPSASMSIATPVAQTAPLK